MEKLMQYVWQHRLWQNGSLRTTSGRRISVIDPGLLNNDAGPDFFNAKIAVDNEVWAGNIEIHVRAADWVRHGHHADPAYDNVILHVVAVDDAVVYRRTDGKPLPQVVMACAPDFHRAYGAMVGRPLDSLACAPHIPALLPLFISDWLQTLAFERLYEKTDRVHAALARLGGDWQSTVYVTLARALGFSTNSDPMERLAFAVPLRALLRHRDEDTRVQGLLYGHAGLLLGNARAGDVDPYMERLRADYAFMAAKYSLPSPEPLGWKMARMRPSNFPHRRIAALAALIADGFRIGYGIFAIRNADDARRFFDISLRGYWAERYTFGPPSKCSPRAFSDASVNLLIINAVVPLLHAYGTAVADDAICARALDILQSLRPESNHITTLFEQAGIRCPDAFTSQALIQLRRAYCEQRKCLYCRIGHRILSAKATRQQ